MQTPHLPVQSLSDEEADLEVAAICSAPQQHRVRSQVCRRHQYFMYNALDEIEETIQQKHRRYKPFDVQGPPAEH